MTDQESGLFWAIADAIQNEATKQKFFMCMGHSRNWEPDLHALVAKILDTKCHGQWRDDTIES